MFLYFLWSIFCVTSGFVYSNPTYAFRDNADASGGILHLDGTWGNTATSETDDNNSGVGQGNYKVTDTAVKASVEPLVRDPEKLLSITHFENPWCGVEKLRAGIFILTGY